MIVMSKISLTSAWTAGSSLLSGGGEGEQPSETELRFLAALPAVSGQPSSSYERSIYV
jgi:hypothetical protein